MHLYKKASILTCLFLLVHAFAPAQSCLDLDTASHARVLNLQFDTPSQLIQNPKTIGERYVLTLAECLELIVSENSNLFSAYQEKIDERLDASIGGTKNDLEFFRAEAKLQWAFVDLKFGHEFDAALNLRESYQIASALKRKAPDYLPIRKTTGVLNVIIGSVPQKYNWVLALLGMDGSVDEGLTDLNIIRKSTCPLNREADLLYALVHGFILQHPDSALKVVEEMLVKNPDERLALFAAAALSIKNFQSELALNYLSRFNSEKSGVPIPYADYLKGEVLLHKGSYEKAIASYTNFIDEYKGQNYIKDATYKIGLCYWLNANAARAKNYFAQARAKGRAESEADKAAERALQSGEYPHVELSKARYFTDGGFYTKADSMLNSIQHAALSGKHHQTEYYYRKARLAHKTNKLDAAKLFYKQTIDLAENEHWYFAPNSCLQMGYILVDQNKKTEARRYFERALEYKNHEYKNSIDAKAKSALGQLRK